VKGDKYCARCRPCSGKVPKNASFSTNGGFSDSCKWACDKGFELNEDGDACKFIPLSNCYETSVTGSEGSLCAGQNFTLKGCAASKEAHQEMTKQLVKWMDDFLELPDSCDVLLFNGSSGLEADLRAYLTDTSQTQGTLLIAPAVDLVPAPKTLVKEVNETGLCGLSEGVPLDYWKKPQDKSPAAERCRSLCPLREVFVESIVGTCTSFQDCPKAINGTKLPCCFALTDLTEKACEGISYRCRAPCPPLRHQLLCGSAWDFARRAPSKRAVT
jgi:hypothetical protein